MERKRQKKADARLAQCEALLEANGLQGGGAAGSASASASASVQAATSLSLSSVATSNSKSSGAGSCITGISVES